MMVLLRSGTIPARVEALEALESVVQVVQVEQVEQVVQALSARLCRRLSLRSEPGKGRLQNNNDLYYSLD